MVILPHRYPLPANRPFPAPENIFFKGETTREATLAEEYRAALGQIYEDMSAPVKHYLQRVRLRTSFCPSSKDVANIIGYDPPHIRFNLQITDKKTPWHQYLQGQGLDLETVFYHETGHILVEKLINPGGRGRPNRALESLFVQESRANSDDPEAGPVFRRFFLETSVGRHFNKPDEFSAELVVEALGRPKTGTAHYLPNGFEFSFARFYPRSLAYVREKLQRNGLLR